MPKVKVHNDNIHPYSELFKGEKVYIPAKEWIEMDEEDAHMFRGTFKSPVLNVDGVHMPEGFKMIRIEKLSDVSHLPKIDDLQCLACKYKASSQTDLSEHLKGHSHQVVIDEEAEAQIKAKRKAKAS